MNTYDIIFNGLNKKRHKRDDRCLKLTEINKDIKN